jgi:hypothetical protein
VGNLLTIFSGCDFSKESVSGEPLLIPSPALNIISTTQPSVLKKLMAPYLQNGFFERFLYINIAGKVPEYKPVIITDDVRRIWTEHIDRLLRNDVREIVEHPKAHEIHVEAMNRWRDEERLLMEFEDGDLFEDVCCSLLEKANYHLCRLSIIAARLYGDNIITAPIMKYSVDCVDYLLNGQKAALLKVLHEDKRNGPKLADAIKVVINHYGLSQRGFADFVGTSQQNINKMMKQ